MLSLRTLTSSLLDCLGKLWTLPNTLAGLALGLASIPFGSKPLLAHNAVVFNRFPIVRRAFVLGNVVLNPGPTLACLTVTYESAALFRQTAGDCALTYVSLGKHEEAHTFQYQLLGPFFLPIYGLSQLLPAPTPFEHAADRYARTGKGWWPWSTG